MIAFPVSYCQQRTPGEPGEPIDQTCDCTEITSLTVSTASELFTDDPATPVNFEMTPYPGETLWPPAVLAFVELDEAEQADYCLLYAEDVETAASSEIESLDVYLLIPKTGGGVDDETYPARIIVVEPGGGFNALLASRSGAVGCHAPEGWWGDGGGWFIAGEIEEPEPLAVVRSFRDFSSGTGQIEIDGERPEAASLVLAGVMHYADGTFTVSGVSGAETWNVSFTPTSYTGAPINLGEVVCPWNGSALSFNSVKVEMDYEITLANVSDGATYVLLIAATPVAESGTLELGAAWDGGAPVDYDDEREIDSNFVIAMRLNRNGVKIAEAIVAIPVVGTVVFPLSIEANVQPVVPSGVTLADTLHGAGATQYLATNVTSPAANVAAYTREYISTNGTVTPNPPA